MTLLSEGTHFAEIGFTFGKTRSATVDPAGNSDIKHFIYIETCILSYMEKKWTRTASQRKIILANRVISYDVTCKYRAKRCISNLTCCGSRTGKHILIPHVRYFYEQQRGQACFSVRTKWRNVNLSMLRVYPESDPVNIAYPNLFTVIVCYVY